MKISDIDVSLSHGKLLGKSQMAPVYLLLCISLLFPLITIVLLIFPFIEWTGDVTLVMVFCNMMFLGILLFFVCLRAKGSKLKAKVRLLLEDAVEVQAYAKKVAEYGMGLYPKEIGIKVMFTIDGIAYERYSTMKGSRGRIGCSVTLAKYADRKINILYSKKYDEVLILKDDIEPELYRKK